VYGVNLAINGSRIEAWVQTIEEVTSEIRVIHTVHVERTRSARTVEPQNRNVDQDSRVDQVKSDRCWCKWRGF
jgi:hypothetical protein